MFKILDQYDTQQNGFLSKLEFLEIIKKVLPDAEQNEIESRYSLAERECGQDSVRIDRLVAIGAYMIAFTAFRSEWKNTLIISSLYRGLL
jgi:hypothetical protein